MHSEYDYQFNFVEIHVNTAKLSVPKHTSSSYIHVLLAEDPRGKCFAIKVHVVLAQNLTNISHVKMLTFWLVLNFVFIYFRFTGIRISEHHW